MGSFANRWLYTQNLLLVSILLFMLFSFLLFLDINLALTLKAFILKTLNNYKSPHIMLYLFKNLSLIAGFVASSYLAFLVFSTFNSLFTYYCYLVISAKQKIRKFNVDNILFKGINWQFQKLGYIFSPVIITMFLICAIVLAGYLGFNQILFFTGKYFSFGVFIINFALFLMLLFLFSTPFISVLLSVLCLYGTEIAISEPDINNKNIFVRSEKLFWQSKLNIWVVLLSSLFIFILFKQLFYFVFVMESIELETFVAYLLFNFFYFICLKFLKVNLYIKCLLSQYNLFRIG